MPVSKSIRISCVFALALTLAGPWAVAQLPGMNPPKHYPWSDASLSPDQRADLVVKEMTLDEKISLLHGVGSHFFRPPESDGRSDGTAAIPRLGIPAIQMADSSYGVTHGAATGRVFHSAAQQSCNRIVMGPRHGIPMRGSHRPRATGRGLQHVAEWWRELDSRTARRTHLRIPR
jgi:hypothetical protein